MIYFAYSVQDKAAGTFNAPFYAQTDAVAIRQFRNVILDQSHQFGMNPEDYDLYIVGIFDDQKGSIMEKGPEKVVTGIEIANIEKAKIVDMFPGVDK